MTLPYRKVFCNLNSAINWNLFVKKGSGVAAAFWLCLD